MTTEPLCDRLTLKSKRRKNSVWFPEGNLIIKVKGDKHDHHHRIHSDILGLHSKVFRDMVAIASDPAQTMIEDCPVVQLHDSPEDVYWLLQVIYFPGIIPVEKLRQETFLKLQPLFLLADKYDMEGITHRLLPMLERDWPTTLHAWDANEAEIKATGNFLQKNFSDHHDSGLSYILPEPCHAISLARRCGLDSILPSAFYHLSRLELTYDLDLYDEGSWDFLYDGGRTANPDLLTAQDLLTLQRGKDNITHWCHDLVDAFAMQKRLQGCVHTDKNSPKSKKCLKASEDLEHALERAFSRRRRGLGVDPLAVMANYQRPEQLSDLCYRCSSQFQRKLDEKRTEFWSELPSFFGLDDWAGQDPEDEGG